MCTVLKNKKNIQIIRLEKRKQKQYQNVNNFWLNDFKFKLFFLPQFKKKEVKNQYIILL